MQNNELLHSVAPANRQTIVWILLDINQRRTLNASSLLTLNAYDVYILRKTNPN